MKLTKKTTSKIVLSIDSNGKPCGDLAKIIRLGLKHFGDGPYEDSTKNVFVPENADMRLKKSGWDDGPIELEITWEKEE